MSVVFILADLEPICLSTSKLFTQCMTVPSKHQCIRCIAPRLPGTGSKGLSIDIEGHGHGQRSLGFRPVDP